MTACCLCSELERSPLGDLWNKPLFESANFVALPSLGSLVEGWLLLVPKAHFLNMGALPNDLASELDALKHRIGSILQSRYGHVCLFEHGPSAPNKSIGCSVDHAHLHLVPITFDLIEAATSFLPSGTKWHSATWTDCQRASKEGKDYLYVEQPAGKGHIAVHTSFGSQVLRKAIAERLGVKHQFNWREYPQIDTVMRTVGTFSTGHEGVASL